MTILTDIKRVREQLDQLVASRRSGLSFKQLRAYEDEPARFFEEVLGVDYVWDKQADLLNIIRDQGRVGVVSGNGLGKTWLLARAALWFLYCRGPCLVLTLGPGDRQLRTIFWKEVRDAWLKAKDLPGELFQMELRLSDTHRMIGFATSESTGISEGRISGHHAERMLVVVEEAHSLEQFVWDGIARLTLGPQSRLVAIGNAGPPAGHWYEIHRKAPANGWVSVKLLATEHPNIVHGREIIPGAVTRQWINEIATIYSVSSGFYKSAVLGEFGEGAPDSLCRRAWFEVADELYRSGEFEVEAKRSRRVFSLDPAAEGDLCALAVSQGRVLRELHVWHEPDTTSTVERVEAHIKRHGCRRSWDTRIPTYRQAQNCQVVVDAVGLGKGPADLLRSRGWKVEDFKGSFRPRSYESNRQFTNMRSEAAWWFRENLQNAQLAIKWDDELVEEAVGIRWSADSGKVMLERKKDFRSRIGRSPDRFDAVVQAFYPFFGPPGIPKCVEPVTWSN